jgi:CMP-N,N'-diacetyllegionaminic acid synthase
MTVLGLVPARGGSKGIPGKNLAVVGGATLLARACACALDASLVARTVVSTDNNEIADAAASAGAEVLRRPAELAQDDTPMLDVVRHAVDELACEIVVLLQPTSPLRTSRHVDEAVALWKAELPDSVVSVVAVPHAFTPGSLLRLDGDRLEPLDPSAPPDRHAKPRLYARNGPAVLVVGADVVRRGSLYGSDSRAYVMPAEASLDVDSPFELELADLLLTRR